MLIKPITRSNLQIPIIRNFVEVWKPITMYPVMPETYMVSNTGKVAYNNGVLLREHIINSGYITVTLKKVDGSMSAFLSHRLLAYEFIPNPHNRATVNHLAEKTFNMEYALEWATQAENNWHAMFTGRQNISGEDNYQSKFTNSQVEDICRMIENGDTYSDILTKIGFPITDNNKDLIGNIKRGKAWLDISQKYNFSNIDYSYNDSIFSVETLHEICKALAENKPVKQVIEEVLHIKYISCTTVNKREYECIRRIKNKKQYTNISDLYF